MQPALLVAAALLAGLAAPAEAARAVRRLEGAASTSPVSKVLPLIMNLKAKVESDGVAEQHDYDQYQCWCEDALGRKTGDITSGKENIEQLQKQIISLKGQLGSHGAEISQLDKDISENQAAQREATEVRNKERDAYLSEHGDSENCVGALEAAVAALTGAGTKGNLLETMHEAQLLSVAADVRRVLQHGLVWRSTPAKDMEVIRRFVADPESLSPQAARHGLVSAAQLEDRQNPFGDYAPQSTVIQGILKGMLVSYRASMQEAKATEAERQKAFDGLMQTKTAELGTLQATLQQQTADEASKEKLLAESQRGLDDAKKQLEADEIFFEDTKESCRDTARAWADRSRRRTEELKGINKAMEILGSPEAQETFASSSSTFVQLRAVEEERRAAGGLSGRHAYSKLQVLAARYRSLGLAEIAAEARTGKHFDKVIVMIDHMIERLRTEEAEDIAHRDRCQNSEGKNANDIEDLTNAKDKAQAEAKRLGDRERAVEAKIAQLELNMNDTSKKMQDLLRFRNQEHEDFKRALKDDTEAIALLQRAVVALSEFYKRNRIPLALPQEAPKYTADPDKAPELGWQGEYSGRKSESTGVISILSMLVTDLENEIKTSRQDDAAAQAAYEKDSGAIKAMMHAQKESYVASQAELAEIQGKITAQEIAHTQAIQDLADEKKLEATLVQDCSWVKTHFQSRRDQRKAELDGLAEAKALLAGANTL